MLTLENLTFSYGGAAKALDSLTAAVAPGLTLLAGPNAGGKTTLLRLLAGLLEPLSGRIVLGGEALPPARLRRIARMVMQDADPQLLAARVGDDIMLGARASNLRDGFEGRARDLCDAFGLAALWDAPVRSLSYGQKRKLCLVHAMAAGPEMLLLDEPFAGLDYPSGKELRRFLQENRERGLRQVVSTHELEPVFDLADRVVVVAEGRVPVEGSPGEAAEALEAWGVRRPGGGWGL